MTTPPPPDPDRPGSRPSVPDAQSPDPRYDEPEIEVPPDRMPTTDYEPGGDDSPAALRIRVENLLLRREGTSVESWAELGEPAQALLVEMLHDWSVRSQDTLFHRVIAVLGDLQVASSVPALGGLLQDDREAPVTRAYAAGSLGRIGDRAAVDALLPALPVEDDMVRRQVAMALGRIDDDAVLPHLLQLRADPSLPVSEVADSAVRRWEERLGSRLGPDGPPTAPPASGATGPVEPAPEVG
jgi:HEAT repeat protein